MPGGLEFLMSEVPLKAQVRGGPSRPEAVLDKKVFGWWNWDQV